MTIMYNHTDHATEFTPDCGRSAVPPGDPAIPDDPTTANDGSTDSFNAAVPDDFADRAAFPDQSQDCDQEVLFDEHLLRLWRTGASQELYLAEEDEDFNVSYYDS